jgi:CobQ-like glutamine amidotransferase family enzyme
VLVREHFSPQADALRQAAKAGAPFCAICAAAAAAGAG